MKIGYLSLFTRDSGGGLSIAYWHSWHSLTWRWSLSFSRFRADEWRVWPLIASHRHNTGSQSFIRIPWVGFVQLSTQRPMWYRDILKDQYERQEAERAAQVAAARSQGFFEGVESRGITRQ